MDFDNYEMKEREQEKEQEQEREAEEEREAGEQAEEETNFDDIDDVLIDIGALEDRIANLDEIPNVGKMEKEVQRFWRTQDSPLVKMEEFLSSLKEVE